MIIVMINLSPKTKHNIITLTAGIANRIFSANKIAGTLNRTDMMSIDKLALLLEPNISFVFKTFEKDIKIYLIVTKIINASYTILDLLLKFKFFITLPEINIELCLSKIEFIK